MMSVDTKSQGPRYHAEAIASVPRNDDPARAKNETHMRNRERGGIKLTEEGADPRAIIGRVRCDAEPRTQFETSVRACGCQPSNNGRAGKVRERGHTAAARMLKT